MRAPAGPAACAALLFYGALVLAHENGYVAEDGYLDDPIDLDLVDMTAVCPTDRLLRSRETCTQDDVTIPCIRQRCCDGYVHIAGRCIPQHVQPCSLNLCEQACEVRGEKLWCSCHQGFRFSQENYARKTQPYCIDVDECASNNGGCEQRCINDPGGFHCECAPPLAMVEGKCIPMPEPLPLMRASSRCYAPCDTVSWLSKKVRQLGEQLRTTQASLTKLMKNPMLTEDGDRFPEGTNIYRVLDATAPLEDGYCRCERGPRGPAGPPGMEGPKGDEGPRGPRGHRGAKASLDMVLLLLAEVRHDIQNLEAKVFQKGEYPERFNLEKAWRQSRKQDRDKTIDKRQQDREKGERRDQDPDLSLLEAFTTIPEQTDTPVEISPHGRTGEITRTEPTSPGGTLRPGDLNDMLREFRRLASSAEPEEEEPDNDYEYSFY